MNKIVKTRKDHPCGCCEDPIKKGEKAIYYEDRIPVYDGGEGAQIGIYYIKKYFHSYRCDLPPETRKDCEEGKHKLSAEYKSVLGDYPAPTGKKVCEHCGEVFE